MSHGGYYGMDVNVQSFDPQDQQGRVGIGQVVHQEIFDTLLLGVGETLRPTEDVFRTPGRIGDKQRTNLNKAGELSDNKQFEICAMYNSLYITQPEGSEAPAGSDAAFCYELATYFTRQQLVIQNASKGGPFLTHRVSGGGGVWAGANENAGAFAYASGMPDSRNVFTFSDPFTVPPLKSFALVLEWAASLPGGTVYPNGLNPLDIFNANNTAIKRWAFGLLGYEVRDATNG